MVQRVREKVFRPEVPPAIHGGLNPQGGPPAAIARWRPETER